MIDSNKKNFLTYTYKDNPYLENTKEYRIWNDAFIHGLNSATKDLMNYISIKIQVIESNEKENKKGLKI